MKWLHFILSHSIFISLCAASLCCETFILLAHPTNYEMVSLLSFCTLGAYNCYWLVSKYFYSKPRYFNGFLRSNITGLLMLVIAAVAVAFLLRRNPSYILPLTAAVILTSLYSLPRVVPYPFRTFGKSLLLKPVLLAFTWTYATVLLPAFSAGFTVSGIVLLLFLIRFCFLLLLSLIFDLRDLKIDKISLLGTAAAHLSQRKLHKIIIAVLAFYVATGLLLAFQLKNSSQAIAFVLTGLTTWFVFRMSLHNRGYVFYYFVVDGLMLLSALLTILATI